MQKQTYYYVPFQPNLDIKWASSFEFKDKSIKKIDNTCD